VTLLDPEHERVGERDARRERQREQPLARAERREQHGERRETRRLGPHPPRGAEQSPAGARAARLEQRHAAECQ
jgi:hypothetical protein